MRHLAFALTACLVAAPIATSQTILHEFPGPAGSGVGRSVSGGLDADGDGVPDYVVSSAYTYPKSASLVSGRTGALHQQLTTIPQSEPFFTSIVCALIGDLDGDGLSEALVGIPLLEGDFVGFQPGTLGVYSGATGSLVMSWSEIQQPGLALSVARVGDLNGDGRADLLYSKGHTYSYYPNNVVVRSGFDGSVIFDLTKASNDYFGSSVSGAGDLDGDGVPDFLAGMSIPNGFLNNPGHVFAISGRTGSTIFDVVGTPFDQLGSSVSGGGDVNGDGVPDFIAGAPKAKDPALGTTVGRALVLSGADGSVLFSFDGPGGTAYFASAVALAGDLDNDGLVDIAIGDPTQSGAAPGGGNAILRSGSNGSILAEIHGEVDDQVGRAISAAGDLNGDGYGDLLLGYAEAGSASPTGAVRAYSFAPGLLQYGVGSPGCQGIHHLNANAVPKVGTPGFRITTGGAPAGSLGLGLIGDAASLAGSDPFQLHLAIHVDVFASASLMPFDAPSDAAGFSSAPLPIPNFPFLQGSTFYAQTIWLWPPAQCAPTLFGLSSSEGLAITIQ